MFSEDLARSHRNSDQERTRKIKEFNDKIPAHEKTRLAIDQRETSWYRPGRQDQNECSILHKYGS